MAIRLSIKYILFRIGKYDHSMMRLFRQERCAPRAPIRCHADFTSCERQHRLAQHDILRSDLMLPSKFWVWSRVVNSPVMLEGSNLVELRFDSSVWLTLSVFFETVSLVVVFSKGTLSFLVDALALVSSLLVRIFAKDNSMDVLAREGSYSLSPADASPAQMPAIVWGALDCVAEAALSTVEYLRKIVQ